MIYFKNLFKMAIEDVRYNKHSEALMSMKTLRYTRRQKWAILAKRFWGIYVQDASNVVKTSTLSDKSHI